MRRGLAARLRLQEEAAQLPANPATSDLDAAVVTTRSRLLADCPALVDLARADSAKRAQLASVIDQLAIDENIIIDGLTREGLVQHCLSEIVGLGPLEALLADPEVSEIMVNAADEVWIERAGRLEPTAVRFRDDNQVLEIMMRIVAPLGRRIDQSSPCVDGRLPDGSRVHAVIPPIAVRGPTLTVRRFVRKASSLDDLVGLGALPASLATFLGEAVRRRLSVVISGGTASGKTTTLNCLASCIHPNERVITIEDAAELRLPLRHVVSLESRPPSVEGTGEVPIRHLVRNALRMRPDRIIIGECRGAEAFDLLQAMNTGHEGALSTVHANSPADALSRLASMVLMAGEGLPYDAIVSQIVAAIDLVAHQVRLADGSRAITDVCVVDRQTGQSGFILRPIYRQQSTMQEAGEGSSFTRSMSAYDDMLRAVATARGKRVAEGGSR